MNSKVVISVGCNTLQDSQMQCLRDRLTATFPDIRYTTPLDSEDVKGGSSIYTNMLAEFSTPLTQTDLTLQLKEIERELGDTPDKRQQGIVMMDLDILSYNGQKHHISDWSRPYIQTLLKRLLLVILILSAFNIQLSPCLAQTDDAKTLLSKAIEYYTGGKYHECILTFTKLEKDYRLTPRYTAYLGYSYYKEGQYEDATKCLVSSIPALTAFSPFEQASYIYACAESYFNQQMWKEAKTWYGKVLPLVNGIDKGDVFYHTGFADYMTGDGKSAMHNLQKADSIYTDSIYGANLDKLHIARKAQTTTMLNALKKINPPEPDPLNRKPTEED